MANRDYVGEALGETTAKHTNDRTELRPANGYVAEPQPPLPNGPEDYGLNDAPQVSEPADTKTTDKQLPALIQSSAQFVADYESPDYVIVGVLQRRFCYSLTAKTGDGKTALGLLMVACVALPRLFGSCEAEKGRVLWFAGENPDDVRARWIATSQEMGFDIDTIDVHFVPGVFKLSEIRSRIEQEAKAIGEFSLIIIDSSAAYFEGADENGNVDAGNHARRLRSLTTLPGGPCVLVLCHPVKNASDDNLIPRGGGAFLAEVDGNLTAKKNDSVVELHWQGKFRGPDFAPMSFALRTVKHTLLKDSKGRSIPTVVASSLSETGRQELEARTLTDQNRVLQAIAAKPEASQADIAKSLGWILSTGDPHKPRVARAIAGLREFKLITPERVGNSVTPRGQKALANLISSASK